MGFFTVVAICVVIVMSLPPATCTPVRTGVTGSCTGIPKVSADKFSDIIGYLANAYNETFHMVTVLHNIYTPKDNQRSEDNPRISPNISRKLRNQRSSHFPDNNVNNGSINVNDALASDYRTVQNMTALYDQMINLENLCDKNRTDQVEETISSIQTLIERTSCYLSNTLLIFAYQQPVQEVDLPDGDLPIDYRNMTATCEADDSNRHKNDYVTIVNTLNYTLSRSHYYSSVQRNNLQRADI